MKKLTLILCAMLLVACSSSSVSVKDIASRMPANKRSFMLQVPATDNPISSAIAVSMVRTSGSNAATDLISILVNDNINVGVFGESEAINKATVLYALNNAKNIGNDVSLYMAGSAGNKADLEEASKKKNVQLHYFVKQ